MVYVFGKKTFWTNALKEFSKFVYYELSIEAPTAQIKQKAQMKLILLMFSSYPVPSLFCLR